MRLDAQPVSCPGAVTAGSPGAAVSVQLPPGLYELRCSGPVFVKPGAAPVPLSSVQLEPTWFPLRVALAGTVTFAAASSADVVVWIFEVESCRCF